MHTNAFELEALKMKRNREDRQKEEKGAQRLFLSQPVEFDYVRADYGRADLGQTASQGKPHCSAAMTHVLLHRAI